MSVTTTNIKPKDVIVSFLTKDNNGKLKVEKAIEKFKKEFAKQKPVLNLIARKSFYQFKQYHKEFNAGTLHMTAPKKQKVSTHFVDESVYSMKDIKLNIFQTGKTVLPKDIFVPYTIGKPIDRLFSSVDKGGPMKGTVTVVTGDPSVGKSTVVYDWQAQLQERYPDEEIICVQSEMKKLDLEFEQLQKPWMTKVKFLLLNEACTVQGKNGESEWRPELLKLVLKKIFTYGYGIIFIDSVQDIIDKLKDFCDMSEGQAERFILGLIEMAADAKNDKGIHTAIIAIQQVTKGGIFKGSNKLKHAITGMLHLVMDDRGQRYVIFSKNRRHGSNTGKKMFFGLNDKNEIEYDEPAFLEAEKIAKDIKAAKEKQKLGQGDFLAILAKQKFDPTTGKPVMQRVMELEGAMIAEPGANEEERFDTDEDDDFDPDEDFDNDDDDDDER